MATWEWIVLGVCVPVIALEWRVMYVMYVMAYGRGPHAKKQLGGDE